MTRLRPEIISTARTTRVDAAEDHPVEALQANAFGVRALRASGAASGAALVHYSSDFVFDGTAGRPYTEDDRAEPAQRLRRIEAAGRVVRGRRAARVRAARREPVRARAGRAAAEGQRRRDREDAAWRAGSRRSSRIARCRRPTCSTRRAPRGSSSRQARRRACTTASTPGTARGWSSRASLRVSSASSRGSSRADGRRAAARRAPAVLCAVEREARLDRDRDADVAGCPQCGERAEGDGLRRRETYHSARFACRWFGSFLEVIVPRHDRSPHLLAICAGSGCGP